MKTIKITIGIILFVITAVAQDIIYLKDGKTIKVKIVEINTREIKYKQIQNEDGPIYLIYKNEVSKIKYQNGSIDEFKNSIPEKNKTDGAYGDQEYRKQKCPQRPIGSGGHPLGDGLGFDGRLLLECVKHGRENIPRHLHVPEGMESVRK